MLAFDWRQDQRKSVWNISLDFLMRICFLRDKNYKVWVVIFIWTMSSRALQMESWQIKGRTLLYLCSLKRPQALDCFAFEYSCLFHVWDKDCYDEIHNPDLNHRTKAGIDRWFCRARSLGERMKPLFQNAAIRQPLIQTQHYFSSSSHLEAKFRFHNNNLKGLWSIPSCFSHGLIGQCYLSPMVFIYTSSCTGHKPISRKKFESWGHCHCIRADNCMLISFWR